MRASSDIFLFADFRLGRAGGGLFRRDDRGVFAPVTIGWRALDLLAVLIDRRGGVVSKEEIMAAVWPKTAVEEGNLFVQISALRAILDREQSGPSCIQTVAGRGYRFIAPVTRCTAGMDSDPPPSPNERLRSFPHDGVKASAPSVNARPPEPQPTVTGEGYKFGPPAREAKPSLWTSKDVDGANPIESEIASPPVTTKRSAGSAVSIVVLPFDNISGDPQQDYFVDGVTESLTTDLSRIRDSFVIARNTAFAYKGRPMDVRAIGRELNVRYILEGSVQRGRERMRVAAQLIDAESGGHIWAERFDQPVADLFELQDAIVGRIAATLNVEIVAAEARRAERRPTPDSIDLYFQAAAWLHRGVTRENVARARPLLARALELDPENAYALVSEAIACAATAASSFSDERIALLASAEACAAKALSLAPEYEAAQYAIGLVFSLTNRAAQGVAACERALALNRNFVPAHGVLSFGKFLLGRGEETEGHIQDALRLSPRDSDAFIWMAIAGAAALLLARDEAAANWLRRSIHAHADYPQAHVLLAAALGNVGRLDDARREVETALALDPTFSIERFRKSSPSDNAVYLEQRERVIDGLRKAGAPER